MALTAILLSEDPEVVEVLRPLLPELGITTDQCAFPDAALRLLGAQKYEAIIVDDEILGGIEFMSSLRQLPMARNAIIFAIIRYISVTAAFQAGANFALEKPLTLERAHRSFRAAQGLMMRERRRYFRHTVSIEATLEFGNRVEGVVVSNLSEGGMAVETGAPLKPGDLVRLRFDLPERKVSIEGKGEVSWNDNKGHAGICFVHIPLIYKVKLEDWLNERAKDDTVALALKPEGSWKTDH